MTIRNYETYLALLTPEEKTVAPKELFYEGDFNLLNSGYRVSVVGSRNASIEGLKRAEIITKSLVKRGITVVSGLAMGIDTVAHTTAIAQGGKTITVLGNPLDKCSPVSNKSLLEEIKKNHLAISQFKEGSKVFPSNFPQRNKTMALISDATIIIEATDKSGTQHQGWEALRLGRSLFILKNVADDPMVTWTNKMIEYGAIVLDRESMDFYFDEMVEFADLVY